MNDEYLAFELRAALAYCVRPSAPESESDQARELTQEMMGMLDA